MSVQVESLWKYPVTGGPGIPVESVEMSGGSIIGDRPFIVAEETAEGFRRLGSKQAPKLLTATYDALGKIVYLDGQPIALPYRNDTHILPDAYCDEFGDATPVWYTSPDLDGAFSDFLDRPVQFLQKTTAWQLGEVIPARARANAALHIISTESVRSIIKASGALEADVRRFKPNIELSGFDEPHQELALMGKAIVLGNVAAHSTVQIDRPTARCTVPSHDPETGENKGDISLRVMPKVENRQGKLAHSAGVYGHPVDNGNRLTVGDELLEVRDFA